MKKVFAVLLAFVVALSLMNATAEASRRHESVGRQIQRVAERNLVRFVDRTMRAHTDNYVNDIYYWHRQQRNRKLQEYRASYNHRNPSPSYNYRNTIPVYNYVIEACNESGRRYAVGGFQMNRALNDTELRCMQKVARALQTGEPIRITSIYERVRIKELCNAAGIVVRDSGRYIYVSA